MQIKIHSTAVNRLAFRKGFAQKVLCGEDFSRKGAKAQSAAAFLRGFLCAFAPLREKSLLTQSLGSI
jgi:hypothetical protein